MLSQIFHFNKVFLAAVLQNLSNSLETLLETFRIQMCWRQLLCFWLQELLERKSLFLMQRLPLQLLPPAILPLQQKPKMISSKRLLSFLPLSRAFSKNGGSSMSLQSLVASSHDGRTLISTKKTLASFFPKYGAAMT